MTVPAALPADAADLTPSEIGAVAVACLRDELRAYPKPGLVSGRDSGSHDDADAALFERSIASLAPFFSALATLGARRAPMAELRRVGLAAEVVMLAATGGINTHRGAIFGLGLLCAAAGARQSGACGPLGRVVRQLWGHGIAVAPTPADSHGTQVRLRYGAGGARAEAAAGFPTIYSTGLPALRRASVLRPGDRAAAYVEVLFALLAVTEDTNLLHRGGPAGLRFAREAAAAWLERGGIAAPDWFAEAERCHRAFVARRLSPGGCADLLAMTLFVARLEGGP